MVWSVFFNVLAAVWQWMEDVKGGSRWPVREAIAEHQAGDNGGLD